MLSLSEFKNKKKKKKKNIKKIVKKFKGVTENLKCYKLVKTLYAIQYWNY
jgi:hypothetical protein